MKICTFGRSDFFTDQPYKLYAISFRFIDYAISSLEDYWRKNAEKSDVLDEVFPSAGFETLKVTHATYKPRELGGKAYWPDNKDQYWWRLTLEGGSITEDFYWKKDEARGWPDKNDKDCYWFTVHHAPSKTKIEGFSIKPNRIKGYPDKKKRYWSYIEYTECGLIEQWMKKADDVKKLQREKELAKRAKPRKQFTAEQEDDVIFLKTVQKENISLASEDSNSAFSNSSPFSPVALIDLYDEELSDAPDPIDTRRGGNESRIREYPSEHRTPELEPMQAEQKTVGEEMFTLSNRILGGVLPELPKLPCSYSWSTLAQFEIRLRLQPLKHLKKQDVNLEAHPIKSYYYHDNKMVAFIHHCIGEQSAIELIKDHEIDEPSQQNQPNIDMTLYTHSAIQEHEKIIFILTNSHEETFIPPIEDIKLSTLRIILVIPFEQYDEFKGYIRKGLDILCIKTLNSPTHGDYAPYLATMNSLRITALIFAMHLQQEFDVKQVIMANHNIVGLYYTTRNYTYQGDALLDDDSADDMNTSEKRFAGYHDSAYKISLSEQWESFYTQLDKCLTEQKECLCMSITVFSERKMKEKSVETNLGSKLFMIELTRLSQKIIGLNDVFYPFFPAATTHFFGEEYLFQLFFNRVADNPDGFVSCDIASSQKFALIYKKQGRNTELKATEIVECILSKEVEDYFEGKLEESREYNQLYSFAVASLTQYKKIVNENKKRWLAELEKIKTTDLEKCFLDANGVLVEDEPAFPPPIARKSFLTCLKDSIRAMIELVDETGAPLVRGYQKSILIQTIESINRGISSGLFEMATGTGKTYIQIYLAIAAYLTGDTRPIFIVTPYQQLAEQAYQDFIKVIDIMPKKEAYPIFPKSKVLKVSADCRNISAGILKLNRTLERKSYVFIACTDSYSAIINSEDPPERYLDPCILFFDESHLQGGVESRYDPETCFMADLSATPRLFTPLNHFHIVYKREQAVRDNILTPCVLAKFEFGFSLKNVALIIEHFNQIYTTIKRPDGRLLYQCKAMVFVPNNSNREGISYARLLEEQCKKHGIHHFSSYGIQGKVNLELFKKEKEPCIAICKEMGTIGFSDNEVDTVIFLRKSSETESAIRKIAQAAGRSLRTSIQEPDKKIAYIITFNTSDTRLLFENESTFYDDAVLERCEEYYKKQLESGLQEIIQLKESNFVSVFQEPVPNKRRSRKRKSEVSLPERLCPLPPTVQYSNSETEITFTPSLPGIENFSQGQIGVPTTQSLQPNGLNDGDPSLTFNHLRGFFVNMQSTLGQIQYGRGSTFSASANRTSSMSGRNISGASITLNDDRENTKKSLGKSLADSSSRMSYDPTNRLQLFSMPPQHKSPLENKGNGDPSSESDEEIYLRPAPVHSLNDIVGNSPFEKANLTIQPRGERELLFPLTLPPNPPSVMNETECRRIGRLGEQRVYNELKEHYRKKYCNHPEAIMNEDFFNPEIPCERGFQINGFEQNGKAIEIRVIWYNKDLPQEQDWMKNHDIKVIKNGEERFIEVKTTKSSDSADLTLTGAEWDLMLSARNRYYIFRVFDVDSDSSHIKKIKNPGAELQNQGIRVESARLSINFQR